MNIIRGRPRAATAEQIQAILDWHRSRRTVKHWVRTLGVNHKTIRSALKDWSTPETWNMPGVRVVRGRKRALSTTQVQQLLEWHKHRRTRRLLALELGVSRSLIAYVVGRQNNQIPTEPRRKKLLARPGRPIPARRTMEWAVRLRGENAWRMHRALELGMI